MSIELGHAFNYRPEHDEIEIRAWADAIPQFIAEKGITFVRVQSKDTAVLDGLAASSAGLRRIALEEPVENLTSLHSFASLESLALRQPSDVLDLARLPKLKRLLVSADRANFANLASSNLVELHIVDCRLRDLAEVAPVRTLEVLSLQETGIESLAELSQMRQLRALYVEKGPLTSLEGAAEAPSLSNVLLASLSRITSVTPIGRVPSLRKLMLHGLKGAANIGDVGSMTQLKTLKLSGMALPEEHHLARLQSLEALSLKSKSALSSLEFLRGMRKLRSLSLEASITNADVSVLLDLPELRWVMYDAKRHHRPRLDQILAEIERRHGTRPGHGGVPISWMDP